MGPAASMALSVINEMTKDEDDLVKGIITLKTTLQNYEKYDAFLQLVAVNSEGELQLAASELRVGLSEVMKVRLISYADLVKDSAEDYAKLFVSELFAECFHDALEETFTLHIGKISIGETSYLKAYQAVKLGVDIGKIAGNILIGAEDVMSYVVEIKAVHDISIILENELNSIKNSFHKDNANVSETDAQNYITYGNYLISSRIRGQYCMTAIYLQPPMQKWLKDSDVENAKALYNRLTTNLLDVKKNLDAICSGSSMIPVLTGIEADTIQYYNCSESGNFAVIGKGGKYGIIGYDGKIILPISYDRIDPGSGYSYDYLIAIKDLDDYSEWGSHVDKNGQLQEGYPDGGDVRPSSYWYDGGVVIFNADSDVMKLEEFLNHEWYSNSGLKTAGLVLDLRAWNSDRLFPVQKISGYTNHNGYYHEPHIDTMQFALMDMNTHELISDFIYEGIDDYNGVSEGLLAVKKDGKWGFVNEEGTVVVDCLYDPYESYTSYGEIYEFVYTAVNGYIAVLKDGKWGLIDTQGNTVVDATYDGISQVNPDGMFWLKENGTWSLYKLNK